MESERSYTILVIFERIVWSTMREDLWRQRSAETSNVATMGVALVYGVALLGRTRSSNN